MAIWSSVTWKSRPARGWASTATPPPARTRPDGPDRIQGVPADVGAAARADPVAGEGLAGLGDGPAGHHGAGDVRAADHPGSRDGGHLAPS